MGKLRLIACDLDGTLLLNGAQSLEPPVFGLIEQLRARGILFFAASGRQYTNLQRLFWPVRERIGYLCENGCLSFYEGRLLHKATMTRELGQELIEAIRGTEGGEVMVSGVMTTYLQPKTEQFYHHVHDVVKNDVELVPDILQTDEDYMKISLYHKDGVEDETSWHERFGARCTVVNGGNCWLDTMPLGVNKAFGMRHVLDWLKLSPEECMAIGDNDNDRELLELVGYPVAMESAKPHIRALAKYQTDTVEHLLEKILAGEMNF